MEKFVGGLKDSLKGERMRKRAQSPRIAWEGLSSGRAWSGPAYAAGGVCCEEH